MEPNLESLLQSREASPDLRICTSTMIPSTFVYCYCIMLYSDANKEGLSPLESLK